jgi:hypothetical protein
MIRLRWTPPATISQDQNGGILMLGRVIALEYVRQMGSGRTCPLMVNCEKPDGSVVSAVAKFSDFCDQRETHLAREIVAACLASDLALPVPEPMLIEIPAGWSDIIPDQLLRARVAASNPIAFGSKLMTGGFSAWTPDTRIKEAMYDIAAAVFAFDAIIQNPDRRTSNPNCLVRGEDIRIFDHELAFAHRIVLEWAHVAADVDSALTLIRDARNNIDACITEIRRVLS